MWMQYLSTLWLETAIWVCEKVDRQSGTHAHIDSVSKRFGANFCDGAIAVSVRNGGVKIKSQLRHHGNSRALVVEDPQVGSSWLKRISASFPDFSSFAQDMSKICFPSPQSISNNAFQVQITI